MKVTGPDSLAAWISLTGLARVKGTGDPTRPSTPLPRLLQVRVVEVHGDRLLLLTPEGLQLRAPQVDPPLSPGMRLFARLAGDGSNPVLELLPQLETTLFRDRLRHLPGDGPATPLASLVDRLALLQRRAVLRRLLPAPALPRLEAVLRRLPPASALATPEGLRTTVESSGLFLEARLASTLQAAGAAQHGAPGEHLSWVHEDLGLALHRLAGALRALSLPALSLPPEDETAESARLLARTALPEPLRDALAAWWALSPPPAATATAPATPKTLARLQALLALRLLATTERWLARLHHQQLRLADQRHEGRLELQVDLPVRHGELVLPWQLHVRRDPAPAGGDTRSAAGERPWHVRIDLVFPELGRLRADVTLELGRRTVGVHLQAERAATVARIRDALPHLAERLAGLDLVPGTLSVRRAPLRETSPPAPERGPGLLDERA